jgi:hypothetical protein
MACAAHEHPHDGKLARRYAQAIVSNRHFAAVDGEPQIGEGELALLHGSWRRSTARILASSSS